jgi:2OG-Fe(II) oxygenase superfamily
MPLSLQMLHQQISSGKSTSAPITMTALRSKTLISLARSLLLVAVTVALFTPASALTSPEWPIMARNAFTPSECDAIIDLYTSQLKRMEDTREADSVSRINRFDVKSKLLLRGDLDWILDRIASKLPLDYGTDDTPISSGEELKAAIDFTLLPEFNPGMHFGLHVDTKPNDKTHRTYNVNIMLSDASSYQGGTLQVGAKRMEGLQKGDVYVYPASFPHSVHQLDGGVRYTYVVAMTVPTKFRSDQQQASYWTTSEERLHGLAGRMGDLESRLHLIHAQFLEASGDRTDADIDAAYCKSYKATPEAPLYAKQFMEHGKAAQKAGDPAAENYFQMAICVDPSLAPVVQALRKDRKLFGVVQGAEL